jgi:hypothetical protein
MQTEPGHLKRLANVSLRQYRHSCVIQLSDGNEALLEQPPEVFDGHPQTQPEEHVVTAVQELHERGVAFVSLKEGLDLSTAAGRLQLHILSALGEFERARLIERTKAGLARARRQGTRLGRRPVRLVQAQLASVARLPVREAARALGVSVNTYRKPRGAMCQQTPMEEPKNLVAISVA